MATILIVDDKPSNRMLLSTLLGYRGHRLVEASGGTEALEAVRSERPDLVITDIMMPGMDGYELVREIRGIEGIPQPRIIFYTGLYVEDEVRALAQACGVSGVICKPAEPEQILKIVEDTLAVDAATPKPIDAKESEIAAVKVLSNKLFRKVEEVEQLNAELERRVATRTAELESANRLLEHQIIERQKAEEEAAQSREERLKAKGEFLSHVSHELRSPLSVVHQFITILQDGLGGPLTANQREYLAITLRNVNQLKYMIDDLLEASRADTSKLTVKRSAISAVDAILHVVESQSKNAAAKGVSLQTDIPQELPTVYADPGRISQVLTNLLDNAVKFSPEGSTVSVRARVFAEDSGFLCVSVADSGCGINPEDAGRVFDRLYQVRNSLSASRRGLGLGLYICKELIGLHGGGIWVDPERQAGTTIHFTLPLFTLNSIIAPIMTLEGRPAPFITLITVEVSSEMATRTERERERMLRSVYKLLERCVLPDLDVLVPLQSCGEADFFSIVARADAQGSQVLLARIRAQLARSPELKHEAARIELDCEVLDSAILTEGLPGQDRMAAVSIRLRERWMAKVKKGETFDDRKENIAGGR